MANYNASDISPRAQANKSQEMAVRRAYQLNAGLIEALRKEGSLDAVKSLHRSIILETKELRNLFFGKNVRSPEWAYPDVWEWTVDHWWSGGLKRSVEVTMHNIHPDNKKAIKGRIDELYS